MSDSVTASDWVKGIALSVAASIIGGASKLAIRKSWLLEHEAEEGMRISQHSSTLVIDEPVCCDITDSCGQHSLLPARSHCHTSETEPMDCLEGDDDDALSTSNSSQHSGGSVYDQGISTLPRSANSWLALILRGSGMLGMSVLNPVVR